MADSYTTIAGDQWDAIAAKVYGNELAAGELMAANKALLGTFQFDAGVVIATPALAQTADSKLPPWRLEADGA